MSETLAAPRQEQRSRRDELHRDFVEKVSGSLRYADDWSMPGMLHGVVVRATLPSARIVSIDTEQARLFPGVRAVLTAADVPHNVASEDPSGLGNDSVVMPVLAVDRVRYDGEPLALVAAETQEAAEAAAQLVVVDLEEIPGVFSVEAAMAPGAPAVHANGNEFVQWHVGRGDPDTAMEQAHLIVDETYHTQHVDHAYLEPESGIGWIDTDGVLTLRVSTQVIEHARELADILQLPQSKVRVIATFMGGGFGGKEDMTVEPHVALLAWKTQMPVRMVWSRQESLLARQKRHPLTMRYRTGVDASGRILAQDITIYGNAGAYPMLSARVLFASAAHACGPYQVEDVRIRSHAIFTNTVPTSAFRGFGAMQVVFAHEQQIEHIAERLGLPADQVRRINFVSRGVRRPSGETLDTEVSVEDCLDQVRSTLNSVPAAANGVRIGRGVACNMHPYGRNVFIADRASAWMGFEPDGTLVIRCGVTDLGAGQAASLVQIASEILGTTVGRTTVHIGDSALNPLAGGTFASRQLYMSGNAVEQVARELRDLLAPVAAGLLGTAIDELVWVDDTVSPRTRPDSKLELGELVRHAEGMGVMPYAHSTYHAETGSFDPKTGTGRTAPDYTYGAHGVEVEVDEATGLVKVLRYVACHDVGRIISRNRVEGQIQGAVAQGVGYALSEDILIEDGSNTTTLFANYLMPTAPQLPDIETIVLERHLGKGPLGARGIGEPPIGPVASAIASAIHDAVGVRLATLPMTPERVRGAIRANASTNATHTDEAAVR